MNARASAAYGCGLVPPARRVQHPHEIVPAVNCWFLPPSVLCGAVAVKAVCLINAEKVIVTLTSA
jgi:hypothetical protein